MTTIKDFIDENDLTVTDVIDALDIDPSGLENVPDEPTDFYDDDPDIETLADDFDAVALLVDQNEDLRERVKALQDDLREARRPVYEEKATRLASMTERWGDEEALMDKFDADDEDERWGIDAIDSKIELAEDIIDDVDGDVETTTVGDDASGDDTDSVSTTTVDTSVSFADEDSVDSTDRGKLDLSQIRK